MKDGITKIKNTCPHCGYFTTAAGHLEKNISPRPEDLSLCMACGEVSEFNEKLKLVKIEFDELSFEDKKEINDIKIRWRQTQ